LAAERQLSRPSGSHAIVDAVQEGGQKRIDLAKAVPVAWIYLDAWASADGTVHYRPVYGLRRHSSTPRATLALRFGPICTKFIRLVFASLHRITPPY